MPAKNHDLHGSIPETCPLALIIVDVINDMEFEGGEALLGQALEMAPRLAAFAQRARKAGVPVVYVNDNFGRWRSDFRSLIDHCTNDGVRGSALAKILRPDESDFFVLKPKHSAFFSTTLDTLLEYLHAKLLIVTGLTTDLCVLFTASDAHMRDLHLVVPGDCCAAASAASHEAALELMRRNLAADATPSEEIEFEVLRRKVLSA
ncbi:MAG: cysteine hydrolase family protein [Gemmatimonadaceae bacterium]